MTLFLFNSDRYWLIPTAGRGGEGGTGADTGEGKGELEIELRKQPQYWGRQGRGHKPGGNV